jgi:hypothetical protein
MEKFKRAAVQYAAGSAQAPIINAVTNLIKMIGILESRITELEGMCQCSQKDGSADELTKVESGPTTDGAKDADPEPEKKAGKAKKAPAVKAKKGNA